MLYSALSLSYILQSDNTLNVYCIFKKFINIYEKVNKNTIYIRQQVG